MRFVPLLVLLAQIFIAGSTAAQTTSTPQLNSKGDPLPEGAVARLGSLRFRLTADASSIALSPDGRTIAFATLRDKQIHFLDTSTGRSLRKFDLKDIGPDPGEKWPEYFRDEIGPEGMQFTADGTRLLISSRGGCRLVDVTTCKVVKWLPINSPAHSLVALSEDGDWAATQLPQFVNHAQVSVLEIKTGKEVALLPGRGALCKGLVFSPDKKHLLICSTEPSNVSPNSMYFGSDSKVAVACIDIEARKIIGETTLNSAQFVALGPDGQTIAVETGIRSGISVRHLPTGTEHCLLPVRESQFAFSHDGKVLFTIDATGRGALWDATKGKKIRDLEGTLANKEFRILGISKGGQTIAVVDGPWYSVTTVVVWNAVTGKRVSETFGHLGPVTCLAYERVGHLLASGSSDKTVRLWNPTNGEHLRLLTVHKDTITALAISRDGKLLASSSRSGSIRLSNLNDGKTIAEFPGPKDGAKALTFSPDSQVLFAGGDSPSSLSWDIAGGKEESVRFKTGDDAALMAFGTGGSLALTVDRELRGQAEVARLQVWRSQGQQLVADISLREEQQAMVSCSAATVSLDGRMIASSHITKYPGACTWGGPARLQLWELRTGRPIRTLGPIVTKGLAFSPDGRILASGGVGFGHSFFTYSDGVDFWDTLTGVKVGSLPVGPLCLAFSSDGSFLATGGFDHSILIWAVPRIETPRNGRVPSAAECETWWKSLGNDAKEAYSAIGEMLAVPEKSVAVLKERLFPVQNCDPDTVAKLIAKLDDEEFREREQAQKSLEGMGDGATELLAKATRGEISRETHRRLEELIRKCGPNSTKSLQQNRAIAVLEWIGTPDARAILRNLAGGIPRARLTIEAQAALRRLND